MMKNKKLTYVPAGVINYGVYFQFTPDGPICTTHHRFIRFGMKVQYFINNKLKCAKYKTVENSNKRFLILREDITGSAPQRDRLLLINK